MVEFTILAMTDDMEWLSLMRAHLQSLGRTRIIVTQSADEACDLLDSSQARLLVVNWGSTAGSLEQIDHLLWANTTLPRPASVLVVADSYETEQALTLFQMGVDEYISKHHHTKHLRAILSKLLVWEAGSALGSDDSAPSTSAPAHSPRPGSAHLTAPAAPA